MKIVTAWKNLTDAERAEVKRGLALYAAGVGFGVGLSIIAWGLTYKPAPLPYAIHELTNGNLLVKMTRGNDRVFVRTAD